MLLRENLFSPKKNNLEDESTRLEETEKLGKELTECR